MPIRVPIRLPIQTRPPQHASPALRTPADMPPVIRDTTTVPAGERPRYQCDVVIPYYRGLQWLPQSIEAILTQNAVECHVHLINDQSPDDDTDIRKAFQNFSNLYWYRNAKNIGPYRSYHQIWARLKTDWFAVQDADDLALPNRLWRAIHALETTGTEIYGAAMEQFLDPTVLDPDNLAYVARSPVHHSSHTSLLAPRWHLINGTLVARRQTIERLNGWWDAFPCGADVEFSSRAQFAGCRIYLDEAVVALRRVHDASLSRGGRWKVGRPDRDDVHAECLKRYAAFQAAGNQFDPRQYGALSNARPELTERVQ